ncbi:helix-turn-helix domain-containing protein [Bacillus methanolicus]|uniref:helix-turn-helix domain-containing protein n=1 Tax=Bacillus methanolicus TaxID=1471 RepID=UPI0023801702|nr:helix-turn-helix transcriptional regulator [Bacillus methanolicus]
MIGLEFICKTFQIEYKKLAEILGITPQTINSWLRGKRKISKDKLKKLSEYFQLPEEYFQRELFEDEMRDISKIYLERKYDTEIEFLENKRQSINERFDLNDMNELILNLYRKVILQSESEPDMRFKMSLIENLLYLLLEGEDGREVSVLWEVTDIMLEGNKKFIDELEKLTGKYL